MPMSVKLSDELVKEARRYADTEHRSVPKQIEHWATIGRIAEENPDLPYDFIKDILMSAKEVAEGKATPYEFG